MSFDPRAVFASVQVIPAEAAHRVDILRFQRAAIDKLPAELHAPAVRQAWRRAPTKDLDTLICAGRYFVVAMEGYLVAGAGWAPAEPANTALMRAVYTDPDFAGLGFGRKALHHIEAAARAEGIERMIVPAALHAVEFYARLGYLPGQMGEADFGGSARFPYREMTKALCDPPATTKPLQSLAEEN